MIRETLKHILPTWIIEKVLAPIWRIAFITVAWVYSMHYRTFVNDEIIIRRNTTDLETFGQVFVAKEYGLAVSFKPRFMIDAGANVGYATMYFKSRFPSLKVIALEPEKSNFDTLVQNTSRLNNVTCLQKGLWNERTNLVVEDIGLGKWGFITREAREKNESDIEAVTVDSILELSAYTHIDILKIDIEGSEKEVFESAENWIGKVNVIFVETHDRFKTGSSHAVYSALPDGLFSEYRRGENIIFVRRVLL